MNLFKTINRRMRVNHTIRELSGLNNFILQDIGIDRANLTEIVEKMIDADPSHGPSANVRPASVQHSPTHYPATHGAAV